MHLERLFSARVSATRIHSKHREQRHLTANYFGVLLHTKRIKDINYIKMRRKIIDEYSLSYLNDLFKTKLIIYDPSRILQHSELVWTLSSV